MTGKNVMQVMGPVCGVNAALCVRGGGRVIPKISASGHDEYWCVGGQFDGQPVIKEI